jgi:hypothetical protein
MKMLAFIIVAAGSVENPFQDMKLIGYWIEDLKDEEFCAPQEVVGFLPPEVRTRIANYLDAGSVDMGNSQFGFSWCRFFCGASDNQMGSKELTDGGWIWPEGLSHYVRAHGIILPEEFVAHALANESARSGAVTTRMVWTGPMSTDYWRKWCAARRSPSFLERLRRARTEADACARIVVQEEIQRRVSEEIACHGLGKDHCIFVGCGERVLSGMKLCARHVIRDTEDIPFACYDLTPELMLELGFGTICR